MIDIDFETDPITEEEVISILGTNYKRQGREMVWKCPACPNGDKAGDNLKFNLDKHIIKCFACDFGQEVTAIIARRRFEKAQGNEDHTEVDAHNAESFHNSHSILGSTHCIQLSIRIMHVPLSQIL